METLFSIATNLWNPSSRGESFFSKYIGTEDINNFANVMKTIKENCDRDENTLLFDNHLLFEADFELISYLKQELSSMDLQNITSDDVRVFDDDTTNEKFLDALKVVCLATNSERNKQIESFIKQIINANVHLKKIHDIKHAKIIYYGNIESIGWRFLTISYLMGIDVVYINPQRDESHLDVDVNIKTYKYNGVLPLKSLEQYASQGVAIKQIRTSTLEVESQIESTLFTNGVYKDWQFNATHFIEPLKVTGNIIDLQVNWKVPQKVREGFNVDSTRKIVQEPFYFYEIEGVDSTLDDVLNVTSTDSVVIEKVNNTPFVNESTDSEIVFTLNSDLTVSDNIKNVSSYRFTKYNDDVENLIIKKINEVIINSQKYFGKRLGNTEVVELVSAVLNMPDKIVHAISGYDYTRNNPKIVVFLAGESQITQTEAYLLAFLASLAADILVLSPAGMSDLSSYISQENFNKYRLRNLSYTERYSLKQKSKSFFGKILEKLT